MNPLFDPRTYAHVPVLLWPLVFLRLWAILAWADYTGCEIIYTVRSNGQVFIRAVSAEASDLNAWLARRRAQPPAHAEAYDLASPPGISLIPVFIGALMLRAGAWTRWIAAGEAARTLPAINNSS